MGSKGDIEKENMVEWKKESKDNRRKYSKRSRNIHTNQQRLQYKPRIVRNYPTGDYVLTKLSENLSPFTTLTFLPSSHSFTSFLSFLTSFLSFFFFLPLSSFLLSLAPSLYIQSIVSFPLFLKKRGYTKLLLFFSNSVLSYSYFFSFLIFSSLQKIHLSFLPSLFPFSNPYSQFILSP